MRTMKKWMTPVAALAACLSVTPAFARDFGHGGGGQFHSASPVPAQPYGGGGVRQWNGGAARQWNGGGYARQWNGGSPGWNRGGVQQWNTGPRYSAPRYYGNRVYAEPRYYGGRVYSAPRYYAAPRYDPFAWRQGRWLRSEHLGHFGWWWVVGPNWYPYTGPVYPYPAYGAWTSLPSQNWYCDSADAYYPDITECPEGWVEVQP